MLRLNFNKILENFLLLNQRTLPSPREPLHVVVDVHGEVLCLSLHETPWRNALHLQRTLHSLFPDFLKGDLLEPRMLDYFVNVFEPESVLHLDHEKRLDEALAFFAGLDIVGEAECSLGNRPLQSLLIVCLERRLTADHLEDETPKSPEVYFVRVLLSEENLGSNVVHRPANRLGVFGS